MNLAIPPLFFYAFGAVLVIIGGLRAYHLGWKQRPDTEVTPPPEPAADAEADAEAAADADLYPEDQPVPPTSRDQGGWSRTAGGGHKRHMLMGLLWMGMGLFLLISTAVNAGP